ncbi:VacJ family lipoprotein [Caenispirillum salinarum]|uniref:MlaA family lipoprotein n=1 Tax=Caenispirillum salinarum TaxID=859058 RepID=UPI00384E94A5
MPTTVIKRLAACVLVSATLTACAVTPGGNDASVQSMRDNDPLETYNRAMFQVNDAVDTVLIRPVAWTYKNVVPGHFQYQIDSFLNNLSAPVVLANDILQGDPDRAFNTFMRFLLNSTFGLAGINDFAAEAGFPRHEEDFGQTLAVWGVQDGPYLVLPILGPSNPRDTIGMVVDSFMDPFNYLARANSAEAFPWGRRVASGIDTRAELIPQYNNLKEESVDFYATIRSAYRQRRAAEIENRTESSDLPEYDFGNGAMDGAAFDGDAFDAPAEETQEGGRAQ